MSTLLSALHRWTRRSEGHIFAFTPEQIGVIEGLRASVAVALFLFLDLALSVPDLAFGAVAAFWTCLCDPGGPDRARLRTMAEFAVGATLAIALAAYGAHWGSVAGGAALFGLVALCGLTRSYRPTFGPMPTPVGLIMAIAVVVGVTSPRSAEAALHLGACFLAGAMWAMVLCLVLWRTHPRAPAQRALAAIFARLQDMTADLLRLDCIKKPTGRSSRAITGARSACRSSAAAKAPRACPPAGRLSPTASMRRAGFSPP